jgi:sulfhydrogenase subunit alpha
LCIGGVSRVPVKNELQKLRADMSDRLADAQEAVKLFETLKMPDFIRETEFVSLKGEENYPWIGGKLVSTDGVLKNENDYLAMTNEYKEEFTTSKFTKLTRKSFAVGALARINNNYEFLKAKDVAESLGLKPVNHNPFMNNIAQLVECIHIFNESLEMLDELLDDNLSEICVEYDVKAGEGVAAVEVPRGILYHHYQLNEKGLIEKANCIIPTTQNNANIHFDLATLVEQAVADGIQDTEVKKLCEMLVRAYDPCISCSVH